MAPVTLATLLSVLAVVLLTATAMEEQSTSRLPGQGMHQYMSERHLRTFFGSEDVDGEDLAYHTASPSQVTPSGSHVSFDLLEAGHHRRRRSLPSSRQTFFKVHGFGRDYHLSVTESDGLYSDLSVIEHLGAGGNVTHHQPVVEPKHCYYRGHVTGMANSSLVAFSTCKGMMGAVYSSSDAFYVHPLPAYLLEHESNTHGHTHLVYRRSIEGPLPVKRHRSCGVGAQRDPSGFQRYRYDNIPYHSAREEILAKSYQNQKSVRNQFGQLYVEMMITADSYMIDLHDGDLDYINSYIFTLMNVMQATLAAESSGFDIRIHVTRIMYLLEPQPQLPVTHDSNILLDRFCVFQHRQNPPPDRHFLHHDYAMLLTGYGLCSRNNRGGCDELGRAFIGTICNPTRSCGLVRDRGIQNGVVMAHEFGHVLGADHDLTICPRGGGYVMEASANDVQKYWQFSDCSKAFFRNTFNSEQVSCLLDCPRQFHGLVENENKLPGELYSLDQQCSFRFRNYSACPYKKEVICQTLFCDSRDSSTGCWTNFSPALDGTPCGNNKICYRRQCVDNSTVQRLHFDKLATCQTLPESAGFPDVLRRPIIQRAVAKQPINGGWADWSDWSACSLTCGGGLMYRRRECINPEPSNGGLPCDGLHADVKPCETPLCSASSIASKPFRDADDICGALGTAETGRLVPHTRMNSSAATACKVLCREISDTRGEKLHDFNMVLPDEAPCEVLMGDSLGSGKCIDGVCVQSIGCDGRLDSGLKKDVCGVCGGTGQCCRVLHRVTQPKTRSRRGRHYQMKIPRGADNIIVRMRNQSKDFVLSVSIGRTGILNHADSAIVPHMRRILPGRTQSLLQYSHPSHAPAYLTVRGSLSSEITINTFRLSGHGEYTEPGVEATYTRPEARTCSQKHYWRTAKTKCQGTCGSGRQTVYSVCTDRSNGRQPRSNECRRLRLQGFKSNTTASCHLDTECEKPARYEWRFWRWSACTRTCGGGAQTRRVACFESGRPRQPPVADKLCTSIRPPTQRSCNVHVCTPVKPIWINKKWSNCSAACGKGVQVRVIMCRLRIGTKPVNVPPLVCQRAGVPAIAETRECTAARACPPRRRPSICNDISDLCKLIRGGGGCNDPGMKNLCCKSCF
eukprot:scpid14367/ scgid31153/ A disintegrin and metalloproteinase with thrombospondin motifs 16